MLPPRLSSNDDGRGGGVFFGIGFRGHHCHGGAGSPRGAGGATGAIGGYWRDRNWDIGTQSGSWAKMLPTLRGNCAHFHSPLQLSGGQIRHLDLCRNGFGGEEVGAVARMWASRRVHPGGLTGLQGVGRFLAGHPGGGLLVAASSN